MNILKGLSTCAECGQQIPFESAHTCGAVPAMVPKFVSESEMPYRQWQQMREKQEHEHHRY